MMARVRKPSNNEITEMENQRQEEDGFIREPGHTVIELDEQRSKPPIARQGGKRLGGPTGGDLEGGGKGPAIGETHAADTEMADHYGSREETQAALEGKIASQNSRKLHEHL
jgi:hypothetical protein